MMMHDKSSYKMFWGVLLITIGVLLWLSNTGVISGSIWDWLFPIVIILMGLKMLMVGHRHGEMKNGGMGGNQTGGGMGAQDMKK